MSRRATFAGIAGAFVSISLATGRTLALRVTRCCAAADAEPRPEWSLSAIRFADGPRRA